MIPRALARFQSMAEEKATNEKEKKKERLESAKENLDRIQKTIKPFIKKNEVVTRSTTGKWTMGSYYRVRKKDD